MVPLKFSAVVAPLGALYDIYIKNVAQFAPAVYFDQEEQPQISVTQMTDGKARLGLLSL